MDVHPSPITSDTPGRSTGTPSHSRNPGAAVGGGVAGGVIVITLLFSLFLYRRRNAITRLREGRTHEVNQFPHPSLRQSRESIGLVTNNPSSFISASRYTSGLAQTHDGVPSNSGYRNARIDTMASLSKPHTKNQDIKQSKFNLHTQDPLNSSNPTDSSQELERRQKELEQQMQRLHNEIRVLRGEPIPIDRGVTLTTEPNQEGGEILQLQEQVSLLRQQIQALPQLNLPLARSDEEPPAYSGL